MSERTYLTINYPLMDSRDFGVMYQTWFKQGVVSTSLAAPGQPQIVHYLNSSGQTCWHTIPHERLELEFATVADAVAFKLRWSDELEFVDG